MRVRRVCLYILLDRSSWTSLLLIRFLSALWQLYCCSNPVEWHKDLVVLSVKTHLCWNWPVEFSFMCIYVSMCNQDSCDCTYKALLVDTEDIKGTHSDVLVLKIPSQQALLPVQSDIWAAGNWVTLVTKIPLPTPLKTCSCHTEYPVSPNAAEILWLFRSPPQSPGETVYYRSKI